MAPSASMKTGIGLGLRLLVLVAVAFTVSSVAGGHPLVLVGPGLLYEAIALYWPYADTTHRWGVLGTALVVLAGYAFVFRVVAAYGLGVAVLYTLIGDPLYYEAAADRLLGVVSREERKNTGTNGHPPEDTPSADSPSTVDRSAESSVGAVTQTYTAGSPETPTGPTSDRPGFCPDCRSDLKRVLFDTACPYCGYELETR